MKIPPVERITDSEISSQLEGGEVLESDRHGWKVFEDSAGNIWKRFRQDRLFSSSQFRPYAVRFARNAARLKRLGLSSIEVDRIGKIVDGRDYLVIYSKVAGETLRSLVTNTQSIEPCCIEMAKFVANLHNQGVYFRGLHLGNILSTSGGAMELIDFSDINFSRTPLDWRACSRNFEPLFRYQEDRQKLGSFGLTRLLDLYLQSSGLAEKDKAKFLLEMRVKYGSDLG